MKTINSVKNSQVDDPVDDPEVHCDANTKPRPVVSVLLCVFNGGRHLRKAVDGILAQTFTDFELLIVDDGSTDNAVDQLAVINDDRIRVLKKTNSGLTRSLNEGLRHCRGDYIARQDADDISHPQRLRHQVMFLQANDSVGVLGSAADLIDDDDDAIGALNFDCSNEALLDSLIKKNQFVHGALMFRRKVLDEVGGYRDAFVYAQDYDLTLRCQEVTKLANLPEKYYQLRFGNQRISINHAREQNGFANMAREFCNQRRKIGADVLQAGSYDGDISTYIDDAVDLADQPRIMLYLYLRSGHSHKTRVCLKTLLQRDLPLKARLKYRLNLFLSYFPMDVNGWMYRGMDRLRGGL